MMVVLITVGVSIEMVVPMNKTVKVISTVVTIMMG